MAIGETFSTGNAVVNRLPVGTVLQVVGQGQLQVTDEAAAYDPQPGDGVIITNKNNREGIVVRGGMNLGIDLADDEILYFSDDGSECVVRRAKKADVQPV